MWRLCNSSHFTNLRKIFVEYSRVSNDRICKRNFIKCDWFKSFGLTFIQYLWFSWKIVQSFETFKQRYQTDFSCVRRNMEENGSCIGCFGQICWRYYCFSIKATRCFWYWIICSWFDQTSKRWRFLSIA